jgi:XTP/dITP diphosphohydrolase
MSSSKILAVATGNAHKLQEFQEILGPAGFLVRSIRDWLPTVPEPEENEPDFPGNSALKARFALAALGAAKLDPTSLPFAVVADDSGLAVDLLGGEPGVYSARFAQRAGHGTGDAANRDELVRRLREAGVGESDHTSAAFVCAIHWVECSSGREVAALGRCEGVVVLQERGTEGFGYDSLFRPVLPDDTLSDGTFGELSSALKHSLSHRGQALRALVASLG